MRTLWWDALVVMLFVLVVVASGYLVWNISIFRQSDHLTPQRRVREMLSFIRSPDRLLSSSTSTEGIQDWMTFDYVNRSFRLPASYLRASLQIADPRYPNMSLRRFARDTGRSFPAAVDAVRSAVRAYVASSTSP